MKFGKRSIKELEGLYKKHFNRLLIIASRYSLNKQNAEDALHDSFIIIFIKICHFRGNEEHLCSWMNRIVINKCLEITRRRNKIKFTALSENELIHTNKKAMNGMVETQMKNEIDNILNMQQKTVFNLKEIEGFSHKEISTLLNINESYSRTILTRAKSKLKVHFSSTD